jgi:LPPG:FO 2-phospho-L-lactate transferase
VSPAGAPVVVLAGGTGGAKLAAGMAGVAGSDALVVIANTADDVEVYGAHVSPDPDLVTFWLADRIDERGWGLAGDTFEVMAGLGATCGSTSATATSRSGSSARGGSPRAPA